MMLTVKQASQHLVDGGRCKAPPHHSTIMRINKIAVKFP